MTLRRGSFPVRARSTRRQTEWSLGPGDTSLTSISASSSVFMGAAIQALVPGLTVIRIRGELLLYLTLGTSAGDGYVGAFGIGIASLAAVTAGIASVPTPITEAGADSWLYHRFFRLSSPGVSTAAALNVNAFGVAAGAMRVEVDSKAMRKFPQDLAIYAAIEVVEGGVATMDGFFNSRSLSKLS